MTERNEISFADMLPYLIYSVLFVSFETSLLFTNFEVFVVLFLGFEVSNKSGACLFSGKADVEDLNPQAIYLKKYMQEDRIPVVWISFLFAPCCLRTVT